MTFLRSMLALVLKSAVSCRSWEARVVEYMAGLGLGLGLKEAAPADPERPSNKLEEAMGRYRLVAEYRGPVDNLLTSCWPIYQPRLSERGSTKGQNRMDVSQ